MSANAGFRGGIDHAVSRFARALVKDPVETLLYVPEHLSMQREQLVHYDPDDAWHERLHEILGAPWPCPEIDRVRELWCTIAHELEGRGLEVGRHTYRGYSDGDLALASAAWCALVHRPRQVVLETGVARGVTTRIMLEALNRLGSGHLWSIDLPHPFDPSLHAQTGVAVPDRLRDRWTYVRGSSRRRLRSVLAGLPRVDLFIHDSLHTARNTHFELSEVSRSLAGDGLMLVDDISTHEGFSIFLTEHPQFRSVVCPSADRLGLFGLATPSPL